MGTTGQPPIYLTILRRGDLNIIDLAEVGALIPRSETQVEEVFLQELATEVRHLATPGHSRRGDQAGQENLSVREPGTVVHDLQRIGGLIFSHLLTEPARKRLRTAAAPCDLYLRLDEQLIQVPWELCYDGQDFLATKFRVGRQVITGYPIPAPRAAREGTGPLKVLLIADPTESLPQASNEAEQLCTLLDTVPGVEVTLLGGKGIRKVPLLAALQEHEVVHFAGHSFYDSTTPSKSGWRLHEGVLTAGEVSKLSRPPLLVFSNSCQAGATAEWEGGYRYEGQAFGIGSAFLLAGVQNYIGTFWVVHDEESVGFAEAFYRCLATGLSLGEALLQARQEVLRQKGRQGLTWASYLLYGDPRCTLLPVAEAQLQPFISPSEQTAQKEQLPHIPYEEHSPWEAVRRYEREQCASLDILGSPASIDTHYQVLPLLREMKRERLPRAGRGRRGEQESAEGHEEEHGGLRRVDILRWEEEVREEQVTYERVSVEQVFKDFQSAAKGVKTAVPRFVVLGPPGSGKTTLAQYLGWQAANEILCVSGRPLLPAWIRLREWEAWATQESSPERSLPAYLTKRYKGLSSAPSAAQWQRWLQKGEVLLLLDGLDEIESKPFFLPALKTALMTCPECPTVLTCRTVSFEQHRTLCPDFPIFTLAGLDADKRNAAISIFPAEHRDRYDPDSLIAQLNRTPQLLALAANPLLLNVICYVVDDAKGVILPATRADLYQKALEKLLIHRPQRVEVRYPGEEPRVNEKLVILERTALNLFVEGDRRLTFTEEELGQALKQALSEEGYGEAPAPWANALRVDLTRNSGILRGSPRRDYFFLHLTVQEFLAAGAIARLVNEQGWDAPIAIGGTRVSVRHVVDRKAWDPRWQEVILLLAGQLGDPAPLLKLLADEKQDDMFRHRLALAALCLSEGRLAVGNPQATLVDRITTAAISYWFRHEKNSTTAAVPHLTQALPALGQMNGCMRGTPLLPWLCQRLGDPDANVRAGAAEALGQIGAAAVQHPEVLSALVTALHNPDVLVRSEIVEALRRMGAAVAQHPEVLTTLGEVALHDPDRLMRTGAARALQQLGATAAQPLEVLLALEAVPHSENQHVRPRAADLLKQVGVETIQHPEALPTLVQVALHDPDVVVRSEAARVLGQLGAVAAQHPEVLYSLEEVALHDKDGGVRSEAAEALGRMGEPVTQHPGVCLALVRMTLHDKDGGVRSRAAGALGQIGEAATRYPEVLSALVASLRDKDTNVRFRAAEALGQMMAQGVRVFHRWWRKLDGKKVEELATLPQ